MFDRLAICYWKCLFCRHWLRHSAEDRLGMIKSKKNKFSNALQEKRSPYPNTAILSREVMSFLRSHRVAIRDFADKILHVNESLAHEILQTPEPWEKTGEVQKRLYVGIMKWLSLSEQDRIEKLWRTPYSSSRYNRHQQHAFLRPHEGSPPLTDSIMRPIDVNSGLINSNNVVVVGSNDHDLPELIIDEKQLCGQELVIAS